MNEIWKDIQGFEGLYQVSNLGRVKALAKNRIVGSHGAPFRSKERILKHSYNDGYPQVMLSHNTKSKTYKVHRLVGMTFVNNPNNYPEINDKDGVKTNNFPENLEWCTTQQNIDHSNMTGLARILKRGECGMAKLVLDMQSGIYYDCMKDAAEAKGLNYGSQLARMSKNGVNRTSLIYV